MNASCTASSASLTLPSMRNARSTRFRAELLTAIQCQPIQWPRDIHSRVPKALVEVCKRCLEKDPAARYDSALELFKELVQWCGDRRAGGFRCMPWLRRWTRQLPVWRAALWCSLILLTTTTITLAHSPDADHSPRQAHSRRVA